MQFFSLIGAIAGPYHWNIPVGEVQRITAISCHLGTAAGGGNRLVNVAWAQFGVLTCATTDNQVTLPGATGRGHTFTIYTPTVGLVSSNNIVTRLPDIVWGPGGPQVEVRIDVDNVFVGDSLTHIGISYQRWRV